MTINKNILLICNYFAPDNAIAAVRTTKLAKFFSEHGYKVDVLTEYFPEPRIEDRILADDAKKIKVYYAYPSKIRKKAGEVYSGLIRPIREPRFNNVEKRTHYDSDTGVKSITTFQQYYPLIASLDYSVLLSKNKGLFKSAKDFLKSACNYDYCIASYGDYFGLLAGLYYKKCRPEVKLITEFRDPVLQKKFTPKYFHKYAKRLEKSAYSSSNLIIAVTEQMINNIPMPYRKKAVCITNGYDMKDRKYCVGKYKTEGKMTFCYTGLMYGGFRDISVIFKAVSELINEGLILSEDIELVYAGPENGSQVFFEQAEKNNISYLCKYLGKVERIESLDLQSSSDILMLSTFDNKDDYSGAITGKALEYMTADKPVITVINGNIEKGAHELGIICNKANLGCVYYESTGREDYIYLKGYILSQYHAFKSGGRVLHDPDSEYLKRFSYDNLTEKYIGYLEEI